MLITIVDRQAPTLLLERVETSQRSPDSWGALFFACSRLSIQPDKDALVLALIPLIGERRSSIYFFDDGDILVSFHGTKLNLLEPLRQALYHHFNAPEIQPLDSYFDSRAEAEGLRQLCTRKLATMQPVETPAPSVSPASMITLVDRQLPPPTSHQLQIFQKMLRERPNRSRLEILCVEDQVFSAKLLASLLERLYHTTIVPTAEQGWEQYLLKAPDIIFLDIELPETNGHQLAAAIHQIDPKAFIVMVTANNQADDVAQAKANGARGFVVKPYSKQKILDSIQKYIHEKKTGL